MLSICFANNKLIIYTNRKPKNKKTVQGVTFRRLKTVARKFVEEIMDDEKELKKKDIDHVADSIKSHIKKMGIFGILKEYFLLFFFLIM